MTPASQNVDEDLFRWLFAGRLVAIALLVFALADWPYGYYQVLRWAVCGVAVFVAFVANAAELRGWTVTFAIVAVLFNPIAPIYLDRNTWAMLDVVTAVVFLASFWPLRKDRLGSKL